MSVNNDRNWKHAFGLLVFILVFIGGRILYVEYDIDENAFCLKKINAEFPEYNTQLYETDGFHSPNTCTVHATSSLEQRDGLMQLNNIDEVELKFALVNSADQEYLTSDNASDFWAIILIGIGVLGMIIIVNSWLEN